MKTFTLETEFATYYDCYLHIQHYYNGNLCITICDSFEPVDRLTVNLEPLNDGGEYAYINVNSLPNIQDIIKNLGIAEYTGECMKSGFVVYPLYKFDMDKLQEYTK